MKKEELVKYAREYIIEQISEGFSFQEIKEKLLETGYDEEIIKEALIDKENEEINALKSEIRKLRIERAHLEKDVKKCKEEKPHSNVFLITVILITCCIIAFSFGYIFKDVLNKDSFGDYVGEKFGNNGEIGVEGGGISGNGDSEIIGSGNGDEDIIDSGDDFLLNDFGDDTNQSSNETVVINTGTADCVYLVCNAANSNLPCNCGNVLADVNNPWCCAISNEVFANVQNENCIFCGGSLTPPGSFV